MGLSGLLAGTRLLSCTACPSPFLCCRVETSAWARSRVTCGRMSSKVSPLVAELVDQNESEGPVVQGKRTSVEHTLLARLHHASWLTLSLLIVAVHAAHAPFTQGLLLP